MEPCATLHSARRLGYQKRNFFGIEPRMEGSKTHFQLRWPRLRHNLGLYHQESLPPASLVGAPIFAPSLGPATFW